MYKTTQLFKYLENKYRFTQTGRNFRLNSGSPILFRVDENDNKTVHKMVSLETIFNETKKVPNRYCNNKYKLEKRKVKTETEFDFLGTDKTLYYGGTYLYFRIKNSDVTIKIYGDQNKPFQVLTRALEDQSFELVNKFNPNEGDISEYDYRIFGDNEEGY